MPLLKDIQKELLDSSSSIGGSLLKLRYLAAQLGSDLLEEWVRYETEGYPKGVAVPDYRMAEVTYSGTFTDGFRTLNNVPIPSALIRQHAGESWVKFSMRDSVAVIESMMAGKDSKEIHNYGVSASDLILGLQGKVYEGMNIIDVQSRFAGAPFSTIYNTVRARILDLTLGLEKSIPVAALISVDGAADTVTPASTAQTTIITHNIVYGNQTNAAVQHGTITFAVQKGDAESLKRWLVGNRIPEDQASELIEIAKSETPDSPEQPFGARAKAWIGEKLRDGASGAIGVGKEVAKDVIIAGLKSYYGLG